MLGVLLTSTCYYPGIQKNVYVDRIDELVRSILSLKLHIKTPYELMILDNSPPDHIPTENILKVCPPNTRFIRNTSNPGKSLGEAAMIRDGLSMSYAQGHKWLLKLTGRYYLEGDWSIEKAIEELEKKRKHIYVHLVGNSMKEMSYAKWHPLYSENLDNDKMLMGVTPGAFIIDPEYAIQKKIFKKEFLHKTYHGLNFEQLFWHAIKDCEWAYWPELPIDGFLENRWLNMSLKKMLHKSKKPVFGSMEKKKEFEAINISPLLTTKGQPSCIPKQYI
ncbi:MAG: hypothetical protein ACE5FU_00170 [Nitrospinota bacterium]